MTQKKIQWVSVRGTSPLENVKLDMVYNKVVDGRLQIPLHTGFADTALQVYTFGKPLLWPGYEVRVAGHSLGAAAAALRERQGSGAAPTAVRCHHDSGRRPIQARGSEVVLKDGASYA